MPWAAQLWSLLIVLVLVPAAGARADASGTDRAAQVIVRGHGVQVTVGELEAALAQQSPRLRERYRDPSALKALVDDMVRAQLLANEAAKRGYERDRAVTQNVKDSAAQGLVRSAIDEVVTPESVSDAEVRDYYEGHPAEFHRPAMRRASVIVFDSAAEAERVLPEARKADARAFSELARQHSREPKSKPQGGDLGYFTREAAGSAGDDAQQPAVPDSVRSAAFALAEIGATSEPVAFAKQFAIVRVSGERPERNVALDHAAPGIRTKLWRERRQRALDSLVSQLRKRDQPKVFTDRIYAIDFADMEQRPSGFAPDPIAPAARVGQ